MRRVIGIGVLATLLVGCFIITGSTTGYTVLDAGTACASAADCGDAGLICCVTLVTPTSVVPACQSADSCTGSTSVQACATNAECGTATCIAQECSFAADAGVLSFCKLVTGCTAVAAGIDAGTLDTGVPADAGTNDATTADVVILDAAAVDSAIADAGTGG